MRRVVITGCGSINALGSNLEETWESLAEGKDGIRELDIRDKERLSSRIGGQVDLSKIENNNLHPKNYSHLDKSTLFAILASRQAIQSSGIDFQKYEYASSAIVLGTAGGGLITQDENFRKVYQERKNRVHPLTIPKLMHNASASHISIENNISGPVFTISTACSSSNHAIGQAFSMIRSGQVLAAISGGFDSMLCFGGLKAWESLRIMSQEKCRPFCATRDGMIQGEGATIFILEDLQHALRRGAKIYAEIAGFSMSSDASDLMSPSFDGLVRAMKLAMDDAKFNLEDIDYINAHGTGTTLNDKTESSAIKSLFGKKNSKYFVSSTKSMHGHLMGGSGAIELLACILALNKGVLAPTINFVKPDPFCDINIVKNSAVENNAERVISNSFAFGGLNAVIALKRF